MSAILPLRCACGGVTGELDAAVEPGTHSRCYCRDCRAAARWLGRADLLDARGGVEVVQTWPARVRLTGGVDAVRLLRLSPRGLHRWYAGCCRTPLANTFGPGRAPFLGVQVPFVAPEARPALDGAFGVAHGVQGRFAPGGVPAGAHASASLPVVATTLGLLVRGAWAGAHRPHPFFAPDGTALATAEVLTPEERAATGDPGPV